MIEHEGNPGLADYVWCVSYDIHGKRQVGHAGHIIWDKSVRYAVLEKIKWDGGFNPAPGKSVFVECRNGTTARAGSESFSWSRLHHNHIIAYAEVPEYQPAKQTKRNLSAPDFLKRAADLMVERGKQYDSPDGERSMERTVTAFNAITGHKLTEAEGWLLMQCLKDVRQWQRTEYHPDSAEDGIAYAALKAEALAK